MATRKERLRAGIKVAQKWLNRVTIFSLILCACAAIYYGIRTNSSGGTFSSFLDEYFSSFWASRIVGDTIIALYVLLAIARTLTNEEDPSRNDKATTPPQQV